jgi:hypothetical protein
MAEERPLTFEWLCQQEPALRVLYEEILALADDPPPCSHLLWMKQYKRRMRRLVGWGAGRQRVPDRVGERLGLTKEENAPTFLTLADMLAHSVEAGPSTGHPALRTPAAYDLAYETLIALLPPCGECSLP